MGSPWAPLCDIALTTLLQFEETSGPADVALEELAKPVLVQIALPNADSADVDPSICLQAGMQGRVAIICIPVVAYAPIFLYIQKRVGLQKETVSWTTLTDISGCILIEMVSLLQSSSGKHHK